MASYQILDYHLALRAFGTEEDTKEMITLFARERHFGQLVEDLHKNIMAMNMLGIRTSCYNIRCAFSYLTYPETINIINEISEATWQKDQQKLIHLHLIFLRKCLILHRELEGYLQRPVSSPDIKEWVGECLKELKIKDKVKEFEGEAQHQASCPGCNIF